MVSSIFLISNINPFFENQEKILIAKLNMDTFNNYQWAINLFHVDASKKANIKKKPLNELSLEDAKKRF